MVKERWHSFLPSLLYCYCAIAIAITILLLFMQSKAGQKSKAMREAFTVEGTLCLEISKTISICIEELIGSRSRKQIISVNRMLRISVCTGSCQADTGAAIQLALQRAWGPAKRADSARVPQGQPRICI